MVDSEDGPEEVTVHEPRHPLFRRSFTVAYREEGRRGTSRNVFVHYHSRLLRIPAQAVLPKTRHSHGSKLSSEAIDELLDTARACGLCESNPIKSGSASRTPSRQKSKTTSQGSSEE